MVTLAGTTLVTLILPMSIPEFNLTQANCMETPKAHILDQSVVLLVGVTGGAGDSSGAAAAGT
eukprot:12559769-Ditylum_brightwellii.AAC.1